jgi:hypothetical protein
MTARPAPGEAVVFVHLPKSGGTTLRRVIARQYPARSIHVLARPVRESVQAFRGLPEPRRRALRLVAGHAPFGLHRFLPQGARYVSMVREPVSRVASLYEHILASPAHKLHDAVARGGMSLLEYVESGVSQAADNGQTRLLSDTPYVRAGTCSQAMLDAARRNIEEHFAVLGVTERFDESLILMSLALGWTRSLRYHRANVTRGLRRPIPEGVREAVARRNALDVELHRFAAERLAARVAEAGPDLQRMVARLRRGNALYGPALRLRSRAAGRLRGGAR